MSNATNGRSTAICAGCGIEFQARNDLIKTGRKLFHSRKCFFESGRINATCKNCGKEFTTRKIQPRVFHTEACAAAYRASSWHQKYQRPWTAVDRPGRGVDVLSGDGKIIVDGDKNLSLETWTRICKAVNFYYPMERPKKKKRKPVRPSFKSEVVPGLGSAIRTAREESGIHLEDLAAKVGCSISVISLIESGKRAGSLSLIVSILNRLNIDLNILKKRRSKVAG